MAKRTKKRALVANPPVGISVYHQKSGKDSTGKRKPGYSVRVGKKFSGKKATFKIVHNLAAAREYIDSLKPHAETIRTSQLTPQQVSETILCLHLLEEKQSSLSLLQAVELAMKYHTPAGGRKTIAAVADEMVQNARSKNAKERSIVQLRSVLDKICDTFKDRLVSSVTSAEIREWLDAPKQAIRERRRVLKGPRKQVKPRNFKVPRPPKVPKVVMPPPPAAWSFRTKNNYLKQFGQIYTFAKRKGYCTVNPCESLDAAIVPRHQAEILTPAQVKALLDAARAQAKPDLLRFVALGAFGWLRRSEICGLTNADFRSDGTILVNADNAKTRQFRYIPVNDTLRAWLAVAPKSDKVTPSENVDVVGHWLSELAASIGIKIPHNALRHSSISYALACAPTKGGKVMVNSAGELAKYAGNSENVIYTNYRQLVTEQAGKQYWSLRP